MGSVFTRMPQGREYHSLHFPAKSLTAADGVSCAAEMEDGTAKT